MKHSEILKKAKRNLWNGKSESELYCSNRSRYVCYAVENAVAHSNEETKKNAKDILKLIRKRLGKDAYGFTIAIEEWLQAKEYDTESATDVQIQKYRKHWVNSLINEYEGVGK